MPVNPILARMEARVQIQRTRTRARVLRAGQDSSAQVMSCSNPIPQCLITALMRVFLTCTP